MALYLNNWDPAVEYYWYEMAQYTTGDDPRLRIAADFEVELPADLEIIVASYVHEQYDGQALVVFKQAGHLFMLEGSHCSCYGLEGQWEPDRTTVRALAKQARGLDEQYHGEGRIAAALLALGAA